MGWVECHLPFPSPLTSLHPSPSFTPHLPSPLHDPPFYLFFLHSSLLYLFSSLSLSLLTSYSIIRVFFPSSSSSSSCMESLLSLLFFSSLPLFSSLLYLRLYLSFSLSLFSSSLSSFLLFSFAFTHFPSSCNLFSIRFCFSLLSHSIFFFFFLLCFHFLELTKERKMDRKKGIIGRFNEAG